MWAEPWSSKLLPTTPRRRRSSKKRFVAIWRYRAECDRPTDLSARSAGSPEKRSILIEPYSPAWPAVFEVHRRRITAALGATACRVDHIGSTAVTGLAAKPIVDI
jgi:GrpB-like predicted nucleotidyltransferase (UPF0157 family)